MRFLGWLRHSWDATRHAVSRQACHQANESTAAKQPVANTLPGSTSFTTSDGVHWKIGTTYCGFYVRYELPQSSPIMKRRKISRRGQNFRGDGRVRRLQLTLTQALANNASNGALGELGKTNGMKRSAERSRCALATTARLLQPAFACFLEKSLAQSPLAKLHTATTAAIRDDLRSRMCNGFATSIAHPTPAPEFAAPAAPHEVRQLQQELLVHLAAHQRQIFAKATRKNRAIKVAGDVILGTGGHNPGHIRHYHRGRPGFVLNPLNGKALYILPVSQQARFQKPEMASTVAAYDIACRLLRAFDPDYAAGEFMVQFALMAKHSHSVACHTDGGDVTFQYALSLGEFEGARLRCYTAVDKSSFVDFDTKNTIVKFDGRLPHEVVKDGFRGKRFSVIFFKNFDARKNGVDDPLFGTPQEFAYGATALAA